jgi:carbon storage regulator
MLALTRKKGDSIVINDNIEIVVLSIHGEQVKLGIQAPKNVAVYRKEVYDQILLENKEALINTDVETLREYLSKKNRRS